MKAVNFKQSNRVYTKPDSMTDEQCSSLHTFTDGNEIISKWEGTFKERLFFLFYGYIWLHVAGTSQPPVLLQAKRTVFLDDKPIRLRAGEIIGLIFACAITTGLIYCFLAFVSATWNFTQWNNNTRILLYGWAIFVFYTIVRKKLREKKDGKA